MRGGLGAVVSYLGKVDLIRSTEKYLPSTLFGYLGPTTVPERQFPPRSRPTGRIDALPKYPSDDIIKARGKLV